MNKYTVFVDDNAHAEDESKRYTFAEFETSAEAIAACKKIVDEFFEGYGPGQYTYDKLWEDYTLFGEDPFIDSDDKTVAFSAWDYAKELCLKLSAGNIPTQEIGGT